MEAYEIKIAELEKEREESRARRKVLISNRDNIQDEYDQLMARELEAQKEINRILQAEIDTKAKGAER